MEDYASVTVIDDKVNVLDNTEPSKQIIFQANHTDENYMQAKIFAAVYDAFIDYLKLCSECYGEFNTKPKISDINIIYAKFGSILGYNLIDMKLKEFKLV